MKLTIEERFWAKVKIGTEDECWPWLAYCKRDAGKLPYGSFGIRSGSMKYAHRQSFELKIGPIPAGLRVLHQCDNPRCVNPKHLFLGTNQENMDDMISKGRKVSLRGEEHGCAKLTEQEARSILADSRPLAQIAAAYDITASQACAIRRGRSWKWLSTGAPVCA